MCLLCIGVCIFFFINCPWELGIGFGFFSPQEESGIEPLSSLPYIFLCYPAGKLLQLCFSPTGTVLHSSSVSPQPNTIQSPLLSQNVFDCQSLSMDFFFLFNQASLILQHMLHNFPSCCFSFFFFRYLFSDIFLLFLDSLLSPTQDSHLCMSSCCHSYGLQLPSQIWLP